MGRTYDMVVWTKLVVIEMEKRGQFQILFRRSFSSC